ncbi:hypothetical protein L2E82_33025 [Cichorium intybus]|uniref:Uncharacterized protein n=1 Tax=Cichorium intybus TaxID=13427 RepID=A0ACB9BIQ2_CICIN|nr:hypothetical protein L2E82_33025 [Cichorium intybus]
MYRCLPLYEISIDNYKFAIDVQRSGFLNSPSLRHRLYALLLFLYLQPSLSRSGNKGPNGAYHIKIASTDLGLLSLSIHVEFGNISAQGNLIKSFAWIATHSKTIVAHDKWTLISLTSCEGQLANASMEYSSLNNVEKGFSVVSSPFQNVGAVRFSDKWGCVWYEI